jgi:hypothetical protein
MLRLIGHGVRVKNARNACSVSVARPWKAMHSTAEEEMEDDGTNMGLKERGCENVKWSVLPHDLFVRQFLLFIHILISRLFNGRIQRLRCLRHELSSLARTLASWVSIPLEARMSVGIYSVLVLFCV